MPNASLSIVDEVEAAIKIGSAEKRLDTVKRVTDLFLLSAGSFNSEQIDLFDEVLASETATGQQKKIRDALDGVQALFRRANVYGGFGLVDDR